MDKLPDVGTYVKINVTRFIREGIPDAIGQVVDDVVVGTRASTYGCRWIAYDVESRYPRTVQKDGRWFICIHHEFLDQVSRTKDYKADQKADEEEDLL